MTACLVLLVLTGCGGALYDRDSVPAPWRRCYPPADCLHWKCIRKEWPNVTRCAEWEEDGRCHVCPPGTP